jgi:hypothetical protein
MLRRLQISGAKMAARTMSSTMIPQITASLSLRRRSSAI